MAMAIRQAFADYINTGTSDTKVWSLCGTGFSQLDESPNPQVESKVYIHQKEASPSITRYEPVFPFETELWTDEAAILKIYNIGRNRSVGADAEVEYLRTDLLVDADGNPITTTVTARLMTVSVEVTDISGEGGNAITVSGNLNQVGAITEGIFDIASRTFVAGKAAGVLTVVSSVGTTVGDTEISVSPALGANNSYKYKLSATDIALPLLNEVLTTGWTAWNGIDEITATDGHYIVVAEVVTATNACVKVGKAVIDVLNE